MDNQQEIIDLCVEVLAYDLADREITIDQNGYNAFECTGLARKILRLLGENEEEAQKRAEAIAIELEY